MMRTFRFEVFPATDQVRVFRLYGPGDKPLGERTLDGVSSFVNEVEDRYAIAALDLPGLGRRLFAWLDGPTERWLAQALPGVDGVALHVEVEEGLRHLPWELLLGTDGFLCADAARPFTPVRRVGSSAREVTIANRALRVLLMACSPLNVRPVLDYEGEERMILNATRDRPIELVVEESGTLDGLREQMESHGAKYFDVFHLTGHADVRDGTPVFVMEDELGSRGDATAEEIAEAFSGIWPRLVFLSGCRTGQAPIAGALPSLAEALVRAGAPAVLGWALPVGDVAASQAAAELYEQLAVGKRVDEAVARARQRLLVDENPFWHLLRLYADATPLESMVTPLRTPKRERVRIRSAPAEFLDAGSKVEVCPRERFVGRRRPLQRCLQVLKSYPGEPKHAEGVLIHGMGGLGKSSLAARLCDRMPEHRRMVLVGNLDEDGFLRALSGKLDSIEALDILNRGDVPLPMRLRQLLDGPLATAPTLFVFDDFEHALEAGGSGYVLRAPALAVLTALLAAIRETTSVSRVIVTSRYGFALPGPARLVAEALTSMRGADLDKKVEQLETLESTRRTDPVLAERVLTASAGNPRLLERLEALMRVLQADTAGVLDAIETKTSEFREELLLTAILARQEVTLRQLVAYGSIFNVPVERSTFAAAVGNELVDFYLDRAISLGLIEAAVGSNATGVLFHVSALVKPLVQGELGEHERLAAGSRAARQLYTVWDQHPLSAEILLEAHRLAVNSNEQEIAVTISDSLATQWFGNSRFRDMKSLTLHTLTLGPDFRLLHNLARAEAMLGDTTAALEHYKAALASSPMEQTPEETKEQSAIIHNYARLILQEGDPERALELYEQSLSLDEKIGNARGVGTTRFEMAKITARFGEPARALKLFRRSIEVAEKVGDRHLEAAALHEMANVYARQNEIAKALDLYGQALEFFQQGGDLKDEAGVLHQIAILRAKQGNRDQALELYRASLDIKKKIEDAEGTAITQASLGALLFEKGDTSEALRYLNEAILTLARIHAWPALFTTLSNLAVVDSSNLTYSMQAIWIGLRVWVPVQARLTLALTVARNLGLNTHAACVVAGATAVVSMKQNEHHPGANSVRASALELLRRVADAAGVGSEGFERWIKAERLLDPDFVVKHALEELESRVADDQWLFDRRLVASV
jgi:tetratricopeptide (TPR) repeat protein